MFDDPAEVILDRALNEHIPFGAAGPRLCLGAHLARIEISEMLTQLLTRFPGLELAGEPTWLASNSGSFGGARRPRRVTRGARCP